MPQLDGASDDFTAIPDAYFALDSEWRFLDLDRAAEEHFGRPARELIGRDIWAETGRPADSPVCVKFHESVARQQRMRFEVESRVRAGRWYELHLHPRPGGGLDVYFHDVTERKRAEQALRESEDRFRDLTEASFEGLVIHADGLVLDVNSRVTEMLGYRPADVVGRSIWAFVPAEYHAQVKEHIASGATCPYEVEVTHRDGRRVPVEVLSRPTTWLGQQVRAAALRDITERKRAQEAQRRHSTVLTGINRVLELALGSQTEEEMCEACLAVVEAATASRISFIGEVGPDGLLHDLAISDQGWDACRMRDSAGHRRPPGGFRIRGFHGCVVSEGRSVIVNEPASHPDRVGLPPGHAPLNAFLGVPLVRKGEPVGMIGVGNREGGYGSEEQQILEALAPVIVEAVDRKRAEDALRRATRRFQTIVDHAPVAIYVKNREGRFVFGNRRLEQYTGRSLEALLGKTDYDFAPKEDADRWREHDLEVLEGRVLELEESGTDAGRRPYVNLSVKFPLTDDSGTPVEVCGISTDITARKHAEAALWEANERLREADRRKDEFIALLSHELRNPLAPIRYALPILRSQHLDDAGSRAMAVIRRQTDQLTRLLDDLLDIGRITSGKLVLRPEQVTLRSVITAAIEAATPALSAAHHIVNIDITPEHVWLNADPARLAQVLANLLDNSAKFTPGGGEIALEATRQDAHAVIRVRDTGIGISADALSRVFDMFHQVEHPGRPNRGLGIGLAIAKRLVEMHDGTLEASSAGVGTGAEFVLRLPVAAEGKQEERAPASEGPSTKGRRLKVLIVDDNLDFVEMASLIVQDAGHEVRKAFDGPGALSTALSCRPDVVLLDLGLPSMSGIDVALELRRDPRTANARLVALTGWGQAEDREKTRAAGFDLHLTKPTHPKELEQLLEVIAAGLPPR